MAPRDVHVTSVTSNSMTVHWQEPHSDGGNLVLGYNVEMKDRNSVMWQITNRLVLKYIVVSILNKFDNQQSKCHLPFTTKIIIWLLD